MTHNLRELWQERLIFTQAMYLARIVQAKLHVVSFQDPGLYLEYWWSLAEKSKTRKTTYRLLKLCLKSTHVISPHLSLAGQNHLTTSVLTRARRKKKSLPQSGDTTEEEPYRKKNWNIGTSYLMPTCCCITMLYWVLDM